MFEIFSSKNEMGMTHFRSKFYIEGIVPTIPFHFMNGCPFRIRNLNELKKKFGAFWEVRSSKISCKIPHLVQYAGLHFSFRSQILILKYCSSAVISFPFIDVVIMNFRKGRDFLPILVFFSYNFSWFFLLILFFCVSRAW